MKALLLLLNLNLAWACSLSSELSSALKDAALSYGLEPALLQALVWQESRYCISALSPEGAIGLGQLMPATARGLGVDPHDPVQNLYGAAAYLRAQWDTFGDWALALAAYNAGPAAVKRRGAVPRNGETEVYVPSVLAKYAELLELGATSPAAALVSTAVLVPMGGGLSVYRRD